jgi:UDP:flavonoid glycosyltransferase YjiC (YdhE family)
VTAEGLARNTAAVDVVRGLFAMVAAAMPYGEKMGLEIDWNNPTSTISKLAVISQTPSEFDFPGSPWPTHFHHAGPFHDDQGREPVPFAWEKLNGRPLVYASLGKLVNGLDFIYKSTLAAIARLPEVQLVISTGGNSSLDDLRDRRTQSSCAPLHRLNC